MFRHKIGLVIGVEPPLKTAQPRNTGEPQARQLGEMVDIVTSGAGTDGASSLYDGLFCGEVLGDAQAGDLRALARVFDLDAGPQVPLAELWRRMRPLIAPLVAGTGRQPR